MTQPVDWPGLGDEELLIAVANTAHGETDEFADPGSVRAWWRSVGAPVPTRRARSATQHGVTMLRELRSLIRGLALRNNEVALLRAMAKPGWRRFKACRGDDCRWVFIDGSRNTSRRWCDMANCGNRAKLATFRARHRPTARKWVDSSTIANEGT